MFLEQRHRATLPQTWELSRFQEVPLEGQYQDKTGTPVDWRHESKLIEGYFPTLELILM